nr:hypothetical protein [uncultured Lichenicoccus sp.]
MPDGEPDEAEQVGVDTFFAWGHNFYGSEDRVCADSLAVRSRVAELLGSARQCVIEVEAAYRREFLPPLSRERPRPDPDAVRRASALEALAGQLATLQGQVAVLPLPGDATGMHRRHAPTGIMEGLADADRRLTGQAELLRRAIATAGTDQLADRPGPVGERVARLKEAIDTRRGLIMA